MYDFNHWRVYQSIHQAVVILGANSYFGARVLQSNDQTFLETILAEGASHILQLPKIWLDVGDDVPAFAVSELVK